MTTKTTKAAKASKKTTTLHIAMAGTGKALCGAKGKAGTAEDATCADCQKVAAHAAEKTKNEAKAPKAEKPEVKMAAKPAAEPAPVRERDPRLPPVGTVLTKKDRAGNVRCSCTITEGGFEYKGTEYRSLSAAAMAAAKDQGTKGMINGFLYFGLATQPRRIADPVEALAHAWERFHEKATSAFASAKDHEAALAKLRAALAGQVKKLEQLAEAQ